MPSTSQLATVLSVFFGMAGFVWLMRRHFSRRWGVPQSRIRSVSLGLALFGIAFAAGASLVLEERDRPTVLKTRLEGTAGRSEGAPAILRSARFEVARPAREHRVRVRAVPERGIPVRGPVRLGLVVLDPGGSALYDSTLVLPVVSRRVWLSTRPGWGDGAVTFRPPEPGRHALRLVPLNAGIRRLEVRIEQLPE